MITIAFTCLAQSTDTIYFNKKWEAIPKKKKYEYFRIMKKVNDSLYTVMDYFKEGQLQMTGAFKSAKQDEEIGEFIWYSKEGEKINLIRFQYDQINDTIARYILNKYNELKLLNSIKIDYHEDYKLGHITSGVTVNGKRYGIWKYLNKKNELVYTFEYYNDEKNVNYVNYFNSDYAVDESAYSKIWLTGYYKNGKEDSVWTYHFPDQSIEKKDRYKDGKKIENVSFIGLGDWYLFKSNECGFKIEFPKEPTTKSETLRIKNGEIKVIGFDCNESKAKNIQNLEYIVTYMELPPESINSKKDFSSSDFFRKLIDKTVGEFGKKLIEKDIELKGYRGKEISMKSKSGKVLTTFKIYLVENKMYMIGTKTDIDNNFRVSTSRFMNSFDLINNN